MSLIIKAAQFSAECHKHQTRKYTNRPYIEHPIRVAGKVAIQEWATEEYVAAAFLHDVIEDCGVTFAELDSKFGIYVASHVFALTNPSKDSKEKRIIRKQMDRDHISKAPDDIKRIKLIDRIDNLREMGEADTDFLKLYLDETSLLLESINLTDDLSIELQNLIYDLREENNIL